MAKTRLGLRDVGGQEASASVEKRGGKERACVRATELQFEYYTYIYNIFWKQENKNRFMIIVLGLERG